ncbi:MAG: hypothetical protein RIK87_14630 [Fuerstiella sp.]
MKTWAQSATVATLMICVLAPTVSNRVEAADLRDAVPPDMYLAIHGRHNPERDYQKKYFSEVWEELQRSRIPERVMQLIQANMTDDDLSEMLAVRDAIATALEPVQWKKLGNCTEVVFGQKMEGIASHQIVILRFPDEAAASLMEGLGNLMKLADDAAGDDLTVEDQTHAGARLKIMRLPPGVPLTPVIGVRDDLFIYGSSPELVRRSLTLLDDPAAESKFDDPRLKAALKVLPAPEDALIFFDGRVLSQQLNGVVAFIQGVGAGNEDAMRVATLINSVFAEVNLIDHEVTVEYTEGYRNRTSTFGKTASGSQDTVLGKMVAQQQPFTDWQNWVPAEASGFSINSGADLHPLYEWVTTNIPRIFPESQEGFAKLEALQARLDLHLDRDILQSFSGETVSVTLPGPMTPLGPSSKSVTFMRCDNPKRIRELVHRGFDALDQIPQAQAQGVRLTESENLEGFDQVQANFFALLGGLNPVIGFRDDWMAIGSHADAVEQVLLTRAGESETFVTTDKFTQFGLEVTGDVSAISYRNTGETIRQISQGLQQAGSLVPMLMMAAGGGGENQPDLAPVQELLGMLPSVGRVLAKMDFYESTLSVTQPGPSDGTYVRHSVTMIRPPQVEAETSTGER